MEYSTPQFLELKPKVAGPLNFRQLVFVGGIGIIILILFTIMPFGKFLLVAIPLAGIALFLAFGKLKGFPAPTILSRSFSFLFKNKMYVWSKKELPAPSLPNYSKKEAEKIIKPAATLKIAEGSRLKKLVNAIEIHR